MKKYLSIYTLLALACIILHLVFSPEEEIFDESSANRATADVIKCQEILKDVPNGWKLEYYIGSNYSAGAVTLLMKFDGKQVEMASETGAESYKPGTIITSLYQVKSEQSTMLTFDSYNPLIHMFSGPLGLNHEPRRGLRVYYNERNSRQSNSARKKIQKHNGDDAYAQRYTMAYSD